MNPSGFDYWGRGAVLRTPSPKHTSDLDYWGRGAVFVVLVHIPAFASTMVQGSAGARGLAASTAARTSTSQGWVGARGLAAASGAHASAGVAAAGARALSSSTTSTSHASSALGSIGVQGQAVTAVVTTSGLVPGSLCCVFSGL